MNNHLVELVLTCGSWQEAQRLADALLEKHLVDSVESFETHTKHWWSSHQHGFQEVKLIVLSHNEQIESIRILSGKLHNIKTAPVMLAELTK